MDFENTKIAFQDKTNQDLTRALFLFRIIEKNWLVKTGKLMLNLAIKTRLPIAWIVKPTLYKHFVGGETIEECQPVVQLLSRSDVKSVLDYSVEGTSTEAGIENALQETIKSVENAGVTEQIPFAVFKPTAMAHTAVLKKVSFDEKMTDDERLQYKAFADRVDKIAETASKNNVRLLIDAEDYWYQKAIDDVVEEMMKKYNQKEVIVFNTLQMYRTDRLNYLKNLIKNARDNNFYAGVKFVRGAYMEKERERAKQLNYPSPINPDKETTDKIYNEALRLSIENIDILHIFNGTHNEYSCELLTKYMNEKQMNKNDDRVYFSQLYGMSDHISYNLADQGYDVAKYIPYGPLKNVAPYLIRRAEENTSVAGQTGRELSLILKEKQRRKYGNRKS